MSKLKEQLIKINTFQMQNLLVSPHSDHKWSPHSDKQGWASYFSSSLHHCAILF